MVGPGHVRVQVAADIKYNHVQQTSETFDPDSKVVRSTQTIDSSSSDATGKGAAVSVASALPGQQATNGSNGKDANKSSSSRNEETTNYEISKTTRTSVDERRRCEASVGGGGGRRQPSRIFRAARPNTRRAAKQDMAQIESLVKSAIGYDKARGDQVEVVNMPFAHMDVGPIAPAPQPLLGLDSAYWFKIIEAAILSLTALLIGLFVVRPLIRNMFAAPVAAGGVAQIGAQQPAGQLAAPGGGGEAAQGQAQIAADGSPAALPGPNEGSMIDIQRIDGQVRESSIKKVGEVVDSHPEEALAILRTWLHQPV